VVSGKIVNLILLGQQETLRHPSSQSLRYKIMGYLCKSRLAANTFPAMIQVSFDCLYGEER
jgi:proteasome component ECM29